MGKRPHEDEDDPEVQDFDEDDWVSGEEGEEGDGYIPLESGKPKKNLSKDEAKTEKKKAANVRCCLLLLLPTIFTSQLTLGDNPCPVFTVSCLWSAGAEAASSTRGDIYRCHSTV